jgi:hypothetical protein
VNELLGRAYLEDAVAKAQKRNASRIADDLKHKAGQARDDAAMFIAENPFAAVAGGLVLGIAIGMMLPRLVPGKALRTLANTAKDAGLAYGRQAWEAARRARAEAELADRKDDE